MTKRIISSSWALMLLVASCQQATNMPSGRGYNIVGDTVHITNDSLFANRIQVAMVQEEMFAKEVTTAGTVQAIPTQFAYIASPFPGRVAKSHIHLGQKVKRNTALFDIVSSDFISVQKDFFQAQSDRQLAMRDMKRKEDLLKNGVGSQKELEEAANVLEIAEKEYENAYTAIKIFQAIPEQLTFGQALVVRSPIDGEIVENKLVTGLYLKDEAEHVAIVADLSKVWIAAQVKEKDIRFIRADDELHIDIPAHPELMIKGKVYHIDEAVDEETRSIKVLAVCDNQSGMLKLGMYATVHFVDEERQYIAIAEKSLLQDDKGNYVYRIIGKNLLVKQEVQVVLTKDGKAFISQGLKKGDTIISEGGYYFQ